MSVKFRNPKTGEIFEVEDCCKGTFCKDIKHCNYYPILTHRGSSECADYSNAHPHEAAKLMEYEVVRKEEPVMENIKPRICEILGLDVNEEFIVENEDGFYHINSIGQVTTGVILLSPRVLCDIINHPEKIKPISTTIYLSEEEKQLIKAIQLLYPRVRYIKKTNDGIVVSSVCGYITTLQCLKFPSLSIDKQIDITNYGE